MAESPEVNATRVICVHLVGITIGITVPFRCNPGLRNMSGYQAINGDIVRAVFRGLLNGRLEQQPYQERSKT